MKLYTFLSILLLLNLVGTKIIKEISCAGEEECDIKFKAFLWLSIINMVNGRSMENLGISVVSSNLPKR